MLSTYLISKDMLGVTITTTYTIINSLMNNNKHNYFSFIEKRDIINKIKIIHQFLEDTLEDKRCQRNKCILLCIESVEDSIKEINNILERINTNYINYKKSWYKYLYRFDCSKDIDRLKEKIDILDARNDMLLKIRSAMW